MIRTIGAPLLGSTGALDRALVISWLTELGEHVLRGRPVDPDHDVLALIHEQVRAVLAERPEDPIDAAASLIQRVAGPDDSPVPTLPLAAGRALVAGLCDGHALTPQAVAHLLRVDDVEVSAALAQARAGLSLPAPVEGCGQSHRDGVANCVECLMEASTRGVANARLDELDAIPSGPVVDALVATAHRRREHERPPLRALPVVGSAVSRDHRVTPPSIGIAELLPREALRELRLDQSSAGLVAMHLQPIVDLRTQRTVGAEALIRWEHPTRGMIPPLVWLAVAERHDTITRVGRWVLETCITLMGGPLRTLPSLSINLSPAEMHDASLPGTIESLLFVHNVAPSRLRLEMTETSVVTDLATARARIGELQRLGVCVDLDGFGVGYSSLEQLRLLHVDGIKLDRHYAPTPDDERAIETSRVVLRFARSLGITATAEGIESEEQATLLLDLDCPRAQGYWFGYPLPVEEFHRELVSGEAVPAGAARDQITPVS